MRLKTPLNNEIVMFQSGFVFRAFNNIINHTHHSFIVALDTKYNFIISNDAHKAMFKLLFGKDVVIGANMLDMLANQPEALQKQKSVWEKALRGEEFMVIESHRSQSQEVRYYEVSYSPLKDKNGKLLGATAITRDFTEKKQQEMQIRELLETQLRLNENLERQNEELATQDEEIRQTNEQLVIINHQLMEEREKLLRTTRELEDRNFELDQIMYKTSHDIRSPITSMLGLLSIIKEEKSMDKIREYLTFLEKRTGDLDRFTKSMLNYGRAQRAGALIEQIDIEQMIDHCMMELKYLPNFDRLQKNIQVNPSEFPFYQDSLRLSIILSNVLSNAVKYQNLHCEQSYVEVKVRVSADEAEICVSDNGIGVQKEYIDKVFNMFFRATDKSEGSGLGMYIVKQTIEKLGGKIIFESKLTKGTKICITLPNVPHLYKQEAEEA
jgi:PAS domain S-box-containing protein